MAQPLKVIAAKCDNLSLIPGAHFKKLLALVLICIPSTSTVKERRKGIT